MKVAILWNFDRAKEIFDNWHDGHKASLELIGKKHQLDWYFGSECDQIPDGYNFLMFWTGCSDPLIDKYVDYKAKKGIILTTDLALDCNVLKKYDVVYCESDVVLKQVEDCGVRAIKCMGTDTDFYKPDLKVKKDIEYFYPATFSPWKRQRDIAYLGEKLLCVGTIQHDGQEDLKACVDNRVKIEIGYFPAEKIRNYYQRAKQIIISAIHGSERTVLEAMACDILPQITNPNNVRALSYLKEYHLSNCKSPRQFVLTNYSHKKFAKKLLEGIEND